MWPCLACKTISNAIRQYGYLPMDKIVSYYYGFKGRCRCGFSEAKEQVQRDIREVLIWHNYVEFSSICFHSLDPYSVMCFVGNRKTVQDWPDWLSNHCNMYVQFCDSTIDNVVFMKTAYIVSPIDGYLSFEWIPFMKLRSLSISPILLIHFTFSWIWSSSFTLCSPKQFGCGLRNHGCVEKDLWRAGEEARW